MTHQPFIGKYTLESLTSGLYLSPLDLYREYVQNAADSIDEAYESQLLRNNEDRITIFVDSTRRKIRIEDNGCGVCETEVDARLVDIGSSQKQRDLNRGFRGIGRLSGLGYCQKLRFVTSAAEEKVATTLEFDASRLQEMISPHYKSEDSANAVLAQVITRRTSPEAPSRHYFRVELENVTSDELLKKDTLVSYLQQNLPVPFSREFDWKPYILSKFDQYGVHLTEYNVILYFDGVAQQLYKPYTNTVLSDRIRRKEDSIQEIEFKSFFINGKQSALMWVARTDFLGTVLDNRIKGIRVRQGNILFGTGSFLRRCFKEERFCGWLVGELHILDEDIIPNTRRDNYEENEEYQQLMSQLSIWAQEISKEIRHLSYERSLSAEEKHFLSSDVNDKKVRNQIIEKETGEFQVDELEDTESVATGDLYSKLSMLMNMGSKATKYNVLNLNQKMSIQQKQTMEHVLDILYKIYPKQKASEIISDVLENF